jgi:hypothetical protein
MLPVLRDLGLAGSWEMVNTGFFPDSMRHRLSTYNRLQNNSILLLTALESMTMMQTLVKLALRQSAFGITAGLLCFT